jgi:putative membrane protein
MLLHWLPTINACLNATSAGLLVAGYLAIYGGRRRLHHRLMLSAVGTSMLFLISYLYYHAHVGATRFAGEGIVRQIYFVILGTHTVLAVLVLPLVAVTVHRAVRDRLREHRRIARVTLPVWLYVSVTVLLEGSIC